MTQEYDKYTNEDHEIWSILFDRQVANLKGKCTERYFECLEAFGTSLDGSRVPDFREVNAFLERSTGWSIEVVKGLIPVSEFFDLLAVKRFPSSTWLRSRNQLDYLEEPDMFHDTFGHVPLIADPTYCQFMQAYGQLGVEHKHDLRVVTALQRVYWFTIEFGLMKSDPAGIYGAGIISSFGETNHVYEDQIELIDFDIEKIIFTPFVNSEIQMRYFLLNDFDQLFDSIEGLKALISSGTLPEPEIVD